jgi:peptidoglycan/LPS O-acetylase OafA/YrhL
VGSVLLCLGLCLLLAGAAALRGLAPTGDLITPGGAGAVWRTLCFGAPAALALAGAVMMERGGAAGQGAASYAVYLLHLILIQMVEKLVGGAALLLIAPPLIALAAHLVHRRVETPLTRWANGVRLRDFPAAPFRWRDSRHRRI